MAGLDQAGKDAPRRICGLTEREVQVLRLVASGKTNKAIARELHRCGALLDKVRGCAEGHGRSGQVPSKGAAYAPGRERDFG
jgi:hypothetical protein